jgi:hypothetical protein
MRVHRTFDPILALAACIFFTCSFDIFLNVNIGPNIRIAQLFMLVLLMAAIFKSKFGLTMTNPLGGLWLIAWLAVQVAFIPVSDYWQNGLAYCLWLALDISLSYALVNLFTCNHDRLHKMLKLYLGSYVFVSCFGIIQFALPVFGGPALLVQQWWIYGRVPRASGFSYEPSYYASYLIMGIVCLGSLRRSGSTEYRTRLWTFGYLVMLLAMILSSSRMGVAFLLLYLGIAGIQRLWTTIKTPRRILLAPIFTSKVLVTAVLLPFIWLSVGGAVRWSHDNANIIDLLAAGTGLFGTASHSVDDRENAFHNTLQVIVEHPLIGRSLGGINESIAEDQGARVRNFEESKEYEGHTVFAEAIAASGIPGSIPFFCFVLITIVAPLRLAKHTSPYYTGWLRALVLALLFEWGILELNQNILRQYLWVHIAILATVFAVARKHCQESGNTVVGSR